MSKFHGARVSEIPFKLIKKSTVFPSPLSTKLTNAQQHYVHNFTQIGQKMGSMGKYFMSFTVPIFM
jgi:hypothetical protein